MIQVCFRDKVALACLLAMLSVESVPAQLVLLKIRPQFGENGAHAGWGASGQITSDEQTAYFEPPPNAFGSHLWFAWGMLTKEATVVNPYGIIRANGASITDASGGTVPTLVDAYAQSTTRPSYETYGAAFEFSGGMYAYHDHTYKALGADPNLTYYALGEATITVTTQESWRSIQGAAGTIKGPGITNFSFEAYCGTITPNIVWTSGFQEFSVTTPYLGYSDFKTIRPWGQVNGPDYVLDEMGASADSGGHAIGYPYYIATKSAEIEANSSYKYRVMPLN